MKKKMCMTIFGISVLMSGSGVLAAESFPVTVTDALGMEVTMEEAPSSIVSLSPASTEILFAVGAGELVTGRTDYCNYPAETADIESIGSYTEPNMELILSKAPDLVVASDYIDDAIRSQLEEAGAAVLVISANNLEGIEAQIGMIGELTGKKEEADAVVSGMEEELQTLNGVLENVEQGKRAFVDLGSFYSAGPGSLLDSALITVGLENICADEATLWPMLSVESILERDPDLYISFYPTKEDLTATAGLDALECLNSEDGFIYIDGMSENGDMLQRPGPRFVEGMEALAKLVYPEAF